MNPKPRWQFMPEMSEAEFARFKQRIHVHGYLGGQEAVTDRHGQIVDGHHRARACAELGTECPKRVLHPERDLTDEEAWLYVWMVNVSRRHLTLDQQRDLVRQWLRRYPETSNRSVAADVGVDDKTVGKIRSEMEASAEIPQTVRPHQRQDQGRNGVQPVEPAPDAVEADERAVMTDVADHRSGVWFEMTIGYPCPSQVPRQRGPLPYAREEERREWHSTRLYITAPAPRSLIEAAAMVKEQAESLWRQIQADPLLTMLIHAS